MGALEEKQAERAKLAMAYRVAKKKQMDALYLDPINGLRFKRFVATLNHFGPDHAERMIEFVRGQRDLWIEIASEDMRAAVIEAIGNRIMRIRVRAGLVPFDDALPDEPDDVWQICKSMLGA